MSRIEERRDLGAVVEQAPAARDEAAPRSRRSTDRLALAIFRLLSDLEMPDRRMVLGRLDALGRPTGSTRARVSLLALERCRSELGVAVPSKARYERWRLVLGEPGVPSASFVAASFGGWGRVLDAAGLEPTADLRTMQLRGAVGLASDDEIIAGLRQCAREVGEPLRFADYLAWARRREMDASEGDTVLPFSRHAFIRRYGSFSNALARAAVAAHARGPKTGRADYRESGIGAVREAHAAVAPAQLTVELYEAWRSIETARRTAKGMPALIPAPNTLRRTHGSWTNALVAAGLMTPDRAAQNCRGRGCKLTDEVYAQSVRLAVEELGPQIRLQDYDEWRKKKLLEPDAPRLASIHAIRRRPGGWGNALRDATTDQATRPTDRRSADQAPGSVPP